MKRRNFEQRRKRVRSKIKGITNCPRISVFRSNKLIYVQIIDDLKGKTLLAMSENEIKEKGTKMEKALMLGQKLAKKALSKKIKKVVFDKSGYRYHGRLKALAEGARKEGLVF